jgi:hypothetical protein
VHWLANGWFDGTLEALDAAMHSVSQSCESAERTWHRLWANATASGGPWFSVDNDTSIKWKRDPKVCAFHCSMKSKRNNHFDPHWRVSLTRDLGSASSAEQFVAGLPLQCERDGDLSLFSIFSAATSTGQIERWLSSRD